MANHKDRSPKGSNGNGKSDSPASNGSVAVRIFVKIFILAFLSAYAAAAILVHCPADLTAIQGYHHDGHPDPPDPTPLLQRLKNAVADRLEPIVIREDEINAYIAATLDATQSGYSEPYVSFRAVWVDLSKNRCRVIMERDVLGRRSTMAIDLKITREGDQFLTEFTGGQFGRLKVVQGFLLLVKHAYDRLATRVFSEELNLIFQMNHIRFDDDQIVLDPRFPKPPNG